MESSDRDVDPNGRPQKQMKNEDGSAAQTKKAGTEFFASLKLAPSDHLNEKTKQKCEKCSKSMKYYCYECVSRVGDAALTPTIALPIELDIVHHPSEKLSKSTAIHAVIVSPNARMHEFPNVPDYDPKDTVLVFPSADAVEISKYERLKDVRRVVVIDSQWQKTNGIIAHPHLAKLPCVVISSHKTYFWRYQPKDMGDDFLATIEAIYYFYREYDAATSNGRPYDGRFDNLLFFFSHIYHTIQGAYKQAGKDMKRMPNFLEK